MVAAIVPIIRSCSRRWRRILWITLVLNAAVIIIEMGAGVQVDSRALQADALDFFGHAANYAISLGVATMALLVNVGVALMLYRYRTGDANMRSVWLSIHP